MSLSSFYKKLNKKSKEKSVVSIGKQVFEDDVEKAIKNLIKGGIEPQVTVKWMDNTGDPKKTPGGIRCDYSIDIGVDNTDVFGFGNAYISNSGTMSCILEFYKKHDRGEDYLMRVNAGSSDSSKFVDNLIDKIKRVLEKAEEEK